MYYLYRNPNIDKFTNKVNIIYTITLIVMFVLFPFILMDIFGTIDFDEKWITILNIFAIINNTLFLTMSWVKKWIKKID